ncbi:MAG: iron export ABC transporter permease subunit FetB [Actinomycetota bacterium]
MDGDVGPLGLALSLVLVAVAIGLSRWQRLGVERTMVVAVVRAVAQLLVVGAALAFVIDPDTPLAWSWAWVVFIVGFSALTVQRRAPKIPGLGLIALAANGAAAAIALGVTFGLGIFPLEPRTLVPISGMMVGNSMNSAVVAAQRLVEELAAHRDEIEARLALGHSGADASRHHVRAALRTAITPQIETTKALGIVFLPGAMTGLILAGVDPLDAVLVQLALMFLILGSVVTVSTVVAVAGARRLFTDDERPVPLLRGSTQSG